MMESKICKTCQQDKPLDQYSPCGNGKHRCASCKTCRATQAKLRFDSTSETARTCKQCEQTKPIDDFPFKRKHGIDYRSHLCRECFNTNRQVTRPSVAQPGWTPPPKPYFDAALGIEVKVCTQCHLAKPVNAFSTQRGKIRAICKVCANTNARADYQADPEKHRRRALDWNRHNPEKQKARLKAWREKNHEYVLIYNQQHNAQRRDEMREYYHRRRNTPGFYREQYQKYRQQILDLQQRRRARIALTAMIETIDRHVIIERDDSTCYLCGTRLSAKQITLDHVIPLARGGEHTSDNLKVACGRCNSRKGTRLLHEL